MGKTKLTHDISTEIIWTPCKPMWPKWFLSIYNPTLPSHVHTTINFEPHDIPMSQHLHHTCFENKKHHGQTTWIIVFSMKSKENHAIQLIHIIFHTKTKISMNINSVAAKANRFPMVPHENQAKPWPLTLDIWPWAMAPGHGDISLGHGNESWAAFQNPHCIHGVPCEFHGNHLKINNFTREMKGIKFLPWGSRRHPLDFSCKL